MTGQAHWLPLAFVFLAALPVAYLWVVDRLEERKYRVERRNVRCRAHGNQLAQCMLVRDAEKCEPIGIRECSLAPADGTLRCGKTCLGLFAHAA